MSGRIKEIHILHVDIPFKWGFKHALISRSQSDSVFLRLFLDDGTVGYGESLPRKYVTGETPQSVIDGLKAVIKQRVLGYVPKGYKDIPSFVNRLGINGGAAKCALELALLDAYGKYFNSPITSIAGERINHSIVYSGVIQAGSMPEIIGLSLAFKIFGLRFIKLKVGLNDDIARLKTIRRILGKDVDIRVDANCAWDADEAIERIKLMREYNISAVEQPIAAGDYNGLKKITDSVPEDIIADESLCTIDDAKRLSGLGACNIFNIRISKCGGLLNSLEIAKIARGNNIGIQLGCQVGESGLLSAAGWHFAGAFKDISFYEGSYGRLLLKEDITKEDITIKRGGVLRKSIEGPGLGVNVLDETLNRYIVSKEIMG